MFEKQYLLLPLHSQVLDNWSMQCVVMMALGIEDNTYLFPTSHILHNVLLDSMSTLFHLHCLLKQSYVVLFVHFIVVMFAPSISLPFIYIVFFNNLLCALCASRCNNVAPSISLPFLM
jgi:hypothetical protein